MLLGVAGLGAGNLLKFHPQAARGISMGWAKSLPHTGTETVRQSQVSPDGFQVLEQMLEQGELFITGSTFMSLPHCPWGRLAVLWPLCSSGGG